MASVFLKSTFLPPRRRVFFSFHYQMDIWCANQIRNSWRIGYGQKWGTGGFFDASIWEKSRRTGPDSLKQLIRNGIRNSSVTCVLVGAQTYSRRWVRYEIARSVIKGNGIFAVNIHRQSGQDKGESIKGPNPLEFIGVYSHNQKILLTEYTNGNWIPYGDYTQAVNLPDNWVPPKSGEIIQISSYCPRVYCYATQNGYRNFASWVELAATGAGR